DLIAATEGQVTSKDIIVNKSEEWKPFTGAFLDDSFLIDYLTPEEYFYFIGELRGMSKTDVDIFLEAFEDVFNNEILDQKKYIRDLSKGNQKKEGVTAALIGEPEVVILAEPVASLDPSTQFRWNRLTNQIPQQRK